MSTGETTSLTGVTPKREDPFRYGWRYLQRGDEYVQIPLRLEDLLHPLEGDHVTQSDLHSEICTYLKGVFSKVVSADPHAVVLFDNRIEWDDPALGAYGPDLAVIFGVREHKNWSTFRIAEEGVGPTLIVEVTSPDTCINDRNAKYNAYQLAGVPFYVIVDLVARRKEPVPRLAAYTLTSGGYQPLLPDERGRLWLEPLRIWLLLDDGEVVCEDEQGHPFPDYVEIGEELSAAQQQLQDANARAAAAEEQLQALQAELRRLRGES